MLWRSVTRPPGAAEMEAGHYHLASDPLLYGVGLAVVLTLFLKETGSAVRPAVSISAQVEA